MPDTLELLDLSFVVVASSHNPTILNPDFLKRNSIVPEDWELEGNPVCAFPLAQVAFKNRISATAQPDRIAFTESFLKGDYSNNVLSGIVKKYVETLPHVDYLQLGINPRYFIPSPGKPAGKTGIPFLTQQLVKDGPWLKFQGQTALTGIRFAYDTSECVLTLNIDEGSAALGEEQPRPGIILASNIHYQLAGNQKERLDKLVSLIAGWKTAVENIEQFLLPFFPSKVDGRKHA